MVTTKLNLSMTEPSVRQIYAKQGDTGRVLDISLDQTPEDGTLRILRPDGVEVTSEAVTGGEVESGGTFESLTEADVTELTVGIEPVQDLSHGDPSPSNICPITGHDEVRVTRTGKNLFDKTNGAKNLYVGNGGVTGTGGTLLCFLAKKGTQYTINMTGGNRTNFYYYNAQSSDEIVAGITLTTITLSAAKPYTFTASQDGVYCYYANTEYLQSIVESAVVELGTTATSYEPYRSNAYTTSLGQAVYGGTLDMVTGVLTVTHGNIASYNGETLPSTWISDRDVYASGTTPTTGAQVVYELATPLTYTLTAHQIKTLVGTNNVWASSGQIVNIKFTYGGLLSELPSDATSIVGKCYCDVEQNGVSSMPFTLNVKKNERAT